MTAVIKLVPNKLTCEQLQDQISANFYSSNIIYYGQLMFEIHCSHELADNIIEDYIGLSKRVADETFDIVVSWGIQSEFVTIADTIIRVKNGKVV